MYKLALILLFVSGNLFCQNRHSFAGLESSIFSDVNLDIDLNTVWSTDRTPAQGYFSAVGNANYVGYSDTYNINGYLKHYATTANQSYTYPVGTGTDLRTLNISGTISAQAVYATAWILGDPSLNLDPTAPNAGPHDITQVQAPLVAVSPVGQWDWIDVNDNSAGVTITVSIPDVSAFSNVTDLRLAGWNGLSWIDLSGAPLANGNTENSLLIGTMQQGITAIAIATVYDRTLPLNLTQFTATANGCNALLSWKTVDEQNVKQFEIEQSFDGATFTKIAVKPALGGTLPNQYSISVAQQNGQGYYRLKMVDLNGAFTYSWLISIRTACNDKYFFVVYPNPVSMTNGIADVSYRLQHIGAAKMILYDANGKRLFDKNIQSNNTINYSKIDMRNLAAGSYYLQIVSTNGKTIWESQKIIKR